MNSFTWPQVHGVKATTGVVTGELFELTSLSLIAVFSGEFGGTFQWR